MNRNTVIEEFVKLNQEDKGKLTLLWLADFIKTNALNIVDVMDILNNVETVFSKTDKFNSMIISNSVSASMVSRLFGFGYAKSMRVINLLIKERAIIKFENRYKIVNKEKFQEVGKRLFENKL